MYDKFVKLYSISTSGQNISLRNQLYGIMKSKDKDMATYLMKISQIRDQLQRHGEIVFYSQMTICVLNALSPDWSSFATNIYSKKYTTPFDQLWAQCILEESRIKENNGNESNERSQAFIVRTKKLKEGKFGKSKKKQNMPKIQCYGCNEYGYFKRDCPNKKDNKIKERREAHIAKEKGEPEKKSKGEDSNDL